MSNWYEYIKMSIEELKKEQHDQPTREKAIVITMLEQALSYAWLFVESK